jgi:hypothetical protein
MLDCVASLVTAAYPNAGLIPQDARALPTNLLQSRLLLDVFELFTRPSRSVRQACEKETFAKLLILSFRPQGEILQHIDIKERVLVAMLLEMTK